MNAICIQCGEEKRRTWDACGKCEFNPNSGTEMEQVRSVYCSLDRLAGLEDEGDAVVRATVMQELREMSDALRRGEPVVYDEAEYRRLLETKRLQNEPLAVKGKVVFWVLCILMTLAWAAMMWGVVRILFS